MNIGTALVSDRGSILEIIVPDIREGATYSHRDEGNRNEDLLDEVRRRNPRYQGLAK